MCSAVRRRPAWRWRCSPGGPRSGCSSCWPGSRGRDRASSSPALSALTVEIAPREQLANANALYGLAASATRIAGPALGGVLVALAGPAVVVAVDAASYLASVLALSLLRMPSTDQATPGDRARRTLFSDMA